MNQEELTKLLENVGSPISRIEEKIGMPKSTLQKALKGERTLPKEWAIKLKDFVAKKQYIGLKRKSSKTQVKDLNEQSEGTTQNIKPPPGSNRTIDTTNQPYINDKIKKKLGIK